MRFRFLSFLVVFALLYNCAETDVDNNVRVIVTGKVVDQNNAPISDAEIKITTEASGNGALEVLLAEGFSDTNGQFEITSLFGSNDIFEIQISNGNSFSKYTYITNTVEFIPEDLEFNLGNIELKALSSFSYSITRESGLGNTLDYSLEYMSTECFQVFENEQLNLNQSFCNELQNRARQLNDERPNEEDRTLIVPLDSEVIFRYSINGGEEISEILTINTTDYEFEFSY